MAVEGYCGLFGSGKTMAMVVEAERARNRNPDIRVLTNLGRLDLPGRPVEYLHASDTLDQMLDQLSEFRDGYLLLDEVGVYLPARVWSRMPAELSWKWQQLRKDAVELRWTCIRPANVVKDLRDITFRTTWCESWRRMGFFSLKRYSYTAVGDRRYYEGRSVMFMRRARAERLYDTLGKVQAAQFVERSRPSGASSLPKGDPPGLGLDAPSGTTLTTGGQSHEGAAAPIVAPGASGNGR